MSINKLTDLRVAILRLYTRLYYLLTKEYNRKDSIIIDLGAQPFIASCTLKLRKEVGIF
ncbi:MAG: hypothetical protein QW096_11645 [Thermofilaceae archaeon]